MFMICEWSTFLFRLIVEMDFLRVFYEKVSLHPITLAFCRGQGHLEKPFMDDYFVASLPIVRFSLFHLFSSV